LSEAFTLEEKYECVVVAYADLETAAARTIHAVAPEWLQWLMTLAFHLALRRVDLVNLRFEDIVGDRIVSPIRKTDTQARDIEATSVDFPIHPDVRRVILEARRSSLRLGRCPFVIHRPPERRTTRAADALTAGRLEHPAQVLPEYASKAFNRARQTAMRRTDLFAGLANRELPTLHEIRALSSHLYARAGYEVTDVQDLMAHTDPDMTRAYQKGHARRVLRIEMILPWSVEDDDHEGNDRVREEPPAYLLGGRLGLREDSLRIF
jgi:integrase